MTKPFLFLFFLLLLSPSLLLGDDYSLNGYWRGNSDGWGCGDNQDKETVIVDMNGDGLSDIVNWGCASDSKGDFNEAQIWVATGALKATNPFDNLSQPQVKTWITALNLGKKIENFIFERWEGVVDGKTLMIMYEKKNFFLGGGVVEARLEGEMREMMGKEQF